MMHTYTYVYIYISYMYIYIFLYPHIILRLVCSNRVENVQYLPIPSTCTSDMVISATLYNYVAVNLFRTSKWERLPCFEFPSDNRITFNKSFSNSLFSPFISHQQTKSSKKNHPTSTQPPKTNHVFFPYQQKLQAHFRMPRISDSLALQRSRLDHWDQGLRGVF